MLRIVSQNIRTESLEPNCIRFRVRAAERKRLDTICLRWSRTVTMMLVNSFASPNSFSRLVTFAADGNVFEERASTSRRLMRSSWSWHDLVHLVELSRCTQMQVVQVKTWYFGWHLNVDSLPFHSKMQHTTTQRLRSICVHLHGEWKKSYKNSCASVLSPGYLWVSLSVYECVQRV